MDRADFLDLFFEESDDRVRELQASLPRLRRTPGDAEVLNLSFRCAHSLKGGSAMMGFALNIYLVQGLYPAPEQKAELDENTRQVEQWFADFRFLSLWVPEGHTQ